MLLIRKISCAIVMIMILASDARSQTPCFMKSATPWADSLLGGLTLEQKIGQMFMVAAWSDPNHRDYNEKKIESLITDYNVGGLIFMQGSPGRQAILTNRFPRKSSVPLMRAMDAEWVIGMRLDATVVDEPLYAHYLSKTDSEAGHPGTDEVLATQENDGDRVVQDVILGAYTTPVVLFKQMTHHSTTSQYGTLSRGSSLINDAMRSRARTILAGIHNGEFAREWSDEQASGALRLQELRQRALNHPMSLAEDGVIAAVQAIAKGV